MTDELISKTDVVKIVKSVLSPASSLTNVAMARRQMLNEINELESKPEPQYKTNYGFMWLCPKCGLPIHSDYTKCVRCGHNREKGV